MLSTIGCLAQKRGYSIFVLGNPMGSEFVLWNYRLDGADAESSGYLTNSYIRMDAPANGLCTLVSKSSIDFSQYTKAKARFKVSMQEQQGATGLYLDLRLYDSQPVIGATNPPEYTSHVSSGEILVPGTYELEFDVSSFTATKYPGFFVRISTGAGSVDIYEWRLFR